MMQPPPPPEIDEKGAPSAETAGEPQISSERLFMQLLAFGGCRDTRPLVEAVGSAGIDAVLYADVNDPWGVGLLTFDRDPDHFVGRVRPTLTDGPFADLAQKHELTMLGRTYSMGHEPDLNDALFERPRRTVLNPDWPWAIWYPLRRSGEFEKLPLDEQRGILMEHGQIGMSFGAADYAHDVRLACHGLDRSDSDFVIGLTGRELYPLSKIVQTMRKTTQTALYLERLGPFFVGRALWQSGVGG